MLIGSLPMYWNITDRTWEHYTAAKSNFLFSQFYFVFKFVTNISVKVATSGRRRVFDSVKMSFVFRNNTLQCVNNKQKKNIYCYLRLLYRDTQYYTRNSGVVTGLIMIGQKERPQDLLLPWLTAVCLKPYDLIIMSCLRTVDTRSMLLIKLYYYDYDTPHWQIKQFYFALYRYYY